MIQTLKSEWLDLDVPGDGHYAAVADVHGRLDLLAPLLDELDRDLPSGASLVMLGDLIDRGPRGVAAVDLVMGGVGVRRVLPIAGNHESMLLHGLDGGGDLSDHALRLWYKHGGYAVVEELDCDYDRDSIRAALGPERLGFLESMLPHHLAGGVLFAHAGLDPAIPLGEQLAQPVRDMATVDRDGEHASMRWVRDEWVGWPMQVEGDLLVVYGHTVQDTRMPLLTPCQAGIDLGAYLTGVLCAAEVDHGRIRFRFAGEDLDPALADPLNYIREEVRARSMYI